MKLGKIAASIMIVLGVLAFFAPVFSERMLIWMMIIGLFVANDNKR